MIVYIHGFNSWGNTEKPQKLREMFPEITVLSPSYDSADFDTIDQLMDGITPDDKLMFIGSSLGGFIAMYLAKLYNTKCILLNPATNATQTIEKYLGKNQNFVTQKEYILTAENIQKLQKYALSDIEDIDIKCFVNLDDETIDAKETLAFFENKKTVVCFPEGGHRFSEIEKVKNDILREYLSL